MLESQKQDSPARPAPNSKTRFPERRNNREIPNLSGKQPCRISCTVAAKNQRLPAAGAFSFAAAQAKGFTRNLLPSSTAVYFQRRDSPPSLRFRAIKVHIRS